MAGLLCAGVILWLSAIGALVFAGERSRRWIGCGGTVIGSLCGAEHRIDRGDDTAGGHGDLHRIALAEMQIRFPVRYDDHFLVRHEYIKRLHERFRAQGITFPH